MALSCATASARRALPHSPSSAPRISLHAIDCSDINGDGIFDSLLSPISATA